MSKTYPEYVNTNFPDAVDTFSYASDVTLDMLPYIQAYQSAYSSGQLSEAAQILIGHPEIRSAMIDASKINNLIDAIKASQNYYLDDLHKYIENIITYREDYSSATKYAKYDLVIYNDLGYLCISSNCPIGTIPTNTYFWIPMTLKGDKGIGIGLSFNGVWDATTAYSSDSAVSFNNCLYASRIDNNEARTPSANSEYWSLIFDLALATNYDNSKTGSMETTMQGAIDELFQTTQGIVVDTNTIKTKLNTIENGAQVNTITGIKGETEATYRTGNVNITKSNIGLSNVDNTADSIKSVNYANGAGNSDTVDGFHFMISSNDIVAGASALSTNLFYFVYE